MQTIPLYLDARNDSRPTRTALHTFCCPNHCLRARRERRCTLPVTTVAWKDCATMDSQASDSEYGLRRLCFFCTIFSLCLFSLTAASFMPKRREQ